MGDLSPWHLLIIAAVILVLFGSAKLPKLAKSLGESMRIFKNETQKLHAESNPAQPTGQPFAQQELPPAQPAPVNQQFQPGAPQAAAPVSETQRSNPAT